jgi:hypothetical protein
MTAARRARATRGLVEMLAQHRQAPSVVLAQIVEILGHTTTGKRCRRWRRWCLSPASRFA